MIIISLTQIEVITEKCKVSIFRKDNNNSTNSCLYTCKLISSEANYKVRHSIGRAVVQAVSRWLPTAAARVRVRATCVVCGGQSGTRAGFLRVLRLLLPIIQQISPSS
jgi:hypothetical protein